MCGEPHKRGATPQCARKGCQKWDIGFFCLPYLPALPSTCLAQAIDEIGAPCGPAFDEPSLLLKAVLTGQGAGLLPAAIAALDHSQGRHVKLADVSWSKAFAYYLVYPQASHELPKPPLSQLDSRRRGQPRCRSSSPNPRVVSNASAIFKNLLGLKVAA